jgi:hypothetical protein
MAIHGSTETGQGYCCRADDHMTSRDKPMTKPKRVSKFLGRDWPSDHAARIRALREISSRLTLHERYLAGEFCEVWAELGAYGEAVWCDPLAVDALAVAFETMHRARMNIETIVIRLETAGYRFHSEVFSPYWRTSQADAGMARMFEEQLQEMVRSLEAPMNFSPGFAQQREQVLVLREQQLASMRRQAIAAQERCRGIVRPIMADAPATAIWIKRVVKAAGEMPLSLRAWHATIGGVNLAGSHPEIAPPGVECDPLFVAPFQFVLDFCQAWAEEHIDEEDPPPFQMPVSPHRTAKAGGDVGAPLYVVTLPNTGLDAVLENEGHGLHFVDYLRRAFEWGGFPGYADMPTKAPKLIASLKEGLLPL